MLYGDQETVFVYGTLQRGQIYHHILQEVQAEFIASAQTVQRWSLRLHPQEKIPFMLAEPGSSQVVGELYTLPAAALLVLDEFEEHPQVYRRKKIAVQRLDHSTQTEGWAYFLIDPHAYGRAAAEIIPHGNYTQSLRDRNKRKLDSE